MTTKATRAAQLLEMARALPEAQAKRDPIAKQRKIITLERFRASFTSIARAHLYTTSDLGARIPLPQDTPDGWRSLYEAALAAEATRPLDLSPPRRANLALVDSDYLRALEQCESEDAEHSSSGGAAQYLGTS